MPQLKNLKHESFCQEVLKSKGNISKAYQEVYNPPVKASSWSNSSNLVKRPNVKARLQELFNSNSLSLDNVIREHSSLILTKTLRVTADTKLNAINSYYKLQGLLSNNIGSQTYNQQINVGSNKEEAQALRNILTEIQQLNASLRLSKENKDSDNVYDNERE